MREKGVLIEYDPIGGTLYLKVREGKVFKTEEYRNEIFLDFDENRNLLGVELLNLEDSKYLSEIATLYSCPYLNEIQNLEKLEAVKI